MMMMTIIMIMMMMIRNGCWVGAGRSDPGMRMSMAIRPQTVANLASKFDSIIKVSCQ